MAITIVGTLQISGTTSGGDMTLTFDGTPAQNDVVFLFGGNAQDDGNEPMGPNTAGYTEIWLDNGDGLEEVGSGAWYKVLGASPDANVVCEGGGDNADGVCYASFVLRGVDTSTPLDATRTVAGPTISTNPDAAAITTVTNGAWVIVAAYAGGADTAVTAPSGYTNSGFAQRPDTNDYQLGVATIEKATAGTENPPNWTGWASATWKTVTVAVRPAGASAVTVDTSAARFALRGGVTDLALGEATVDTSAARFALRAGASSLDLGGAAVDTSASHLVLRAGITDVDVAGECGPSMPALQMAITHGGPWAPTSWGAFGPHWLWVQPCEGGVQPVTVDTSAARFALRAGTSTVEAGETEIETQAARFVLRAATTSVETQGETIDTSAARFALRAGATTLELGEVTVATEGARVVLRAAVSEVEVGEAVIDTQAAHFVLRAGTTTVEGGVIVVPRIVCEILRLGVECETLRVGVDDAILRLGVECEVNP